MSTEEIKSIAHRFFAEQDRRKGPLAPELCAPNYTAYIGGYPPVDLEGHNQMALMFYGAFPDLNQTIEDTIAEGDKVVLRFTLRGTHKGDFMDIPATNKSITVGGIAFLRVVNGKVAELREQFDQTGMMQQLGVMPMPEEGGA